MYLGFEEVEGEEDEWRPEFPCPLCDEDFDIVGLCCHIDDDHPFEAKNGHKRRLRKGSTGSHGALNFLRKELRDGSLQSLLGGSSRLITPSHTAPDPLLSSFISNLPIGDSSRMVEPEPLDEGIKKISEEKVVESASSPVLSDKDLKEMVRRSEFTQELLLSTIFDQIL